MRRRRDRSPWCHCKGRGRCHVFLILQKVRPAVVRSVQAEQVGGHGIGPKSLTFCFRMDSYKAFLQFVAVAG